MPTTVAWLEEQLKARSTKIELGDIHEWSDAQLEQGGLLLAEYGDCVEELVGAALHCYLTHCALQCTCGLCLRLSVYACGLLVVAVPASWWGTGSLAVFLPRWV